MYDSMLRDKCVDPHQYDALIMLIMKFNDSCKEDQAWAESVVNDCISSVVFGGNSDMSTGMCKATVDNSSIGRRARLSFEPLCAATPNCSLAREITQMVVKG